MTTNITFKNQPKLSKDEVDKKRNELRLALIPDIEQFLNTDEFFKDKEVTVEFAHSGVSSLVSFLEVENKKFVLKIPLNNTVPSRSEALFLKKWESVNIAVQHVVNEGMLNTRPYTLMDYVDAPIVEEKYKGDSEEKEQIYFEAGKILRAMHEPEAVGFGLYVNGRGQYDSFEEWLNSEDMQKREKYVIEAQILNELHGAYDSAKKVLIEYVGKDTKSSYCHFDYSTGHLFLTEPKLTVFDPNPFFNHGYIDFGRTLVNYIGKTGTYPKKLVEGYAEGNEIDVCALHAAIYVNIMYKLPYQHQKSKTEVIENFKNYLISNKLLLLR